MTLAGTRPPTVDEWEKYELHHRARLAIKPGLACYIGYAMIHYYLMYRVSKEEEKQIPFNVYFIWGPAIVFVLLAIVSSLLYSHVKLRVLFIVLLGGALAIAGYKSRNILSKLLKK